MCCTRHLRRLELRYQLCSWLTGRPSSGDLKSSERRHNSLPTESCRTSEETRARKSCILGHGYLSYCGDLEAQVCPDHWGSCCPAVIWGNPLLLSRGLEAGAYCPILSTSSPQGSPGTLLRAQ